MPLVFRPSNSSLIVLEILCYGGCLGRFYAYYSSQSSIYLVDAIFLHDIFLKVVDSIFRK